MARERLRLASANPDKAAEIAAILDGRVELLPRPDVPDVVEDGDTLEDNARLKAVAICEATGEAAIADDTGLEVDALDGAPGVYSARYAGEDASYEDNVAKVLAELERVGAVDPVGRTARFRTVAIVHRPDGSELMVEGSVEGTIAAAPRGTNGFGYDPIFIPREGGGLTFAEMDTKAKHEISHRGRAFRTLAAALMSGA